MLYTHNVFFAVIEPISLESLLFSFERLEFLSNIRIDKVSDILSIHDFWDNIRFPFGISQEVVLCKTPSAFAFKEKKSQAYVSC